ncbi:hypothetical protein NLU13_7593 [Sarocladium strictum]|uniref:Domain of unknown function at the cortex 1 domain-containing protein n=1 Tax=Sarocladium strictum TaxID=5046 RepID=A0AA39L5W2_SARSR|nr:hypothetical protein NLU13_7593 [Sarocladium strictum]
MAEKYILRITAGPDYDSAHKHEVPVNRAEPVQIKSEAADIELNVRIQNYSGLPRGSPSTSPYFDTPPHDYNQDQYSIAFRFTPRKPATAKEVGKDDEAEDVEDGISGVDLQFGNDFDRPIRDKLPPGFNTALNIVKWWIDPGLEGDAYADRPYMYGPALSSFNCVHVGAGEHSHEKGGLWFEEGGDEEGMRFREEVGAPATAKGRMKWALGNKAKEDWVFQYGKTYGMDLYNPYIDFTNLALRLPGFHLPIVRYWDGQGLRPDARRSHELRYVLRNKKTGQIYLVVLFSLYLKEDINEDGSVKEGAEHRAAASAEQGPKHEETHNEEEALKQARDKLGAPQGGADTNEDDVD